MATMALARANVEIEALKAEVQRHVTLYQTMQANWHRRQDNWRESSDRCLKAAEAQLAGANGTNARWMAATGYLSPEEYAASDEVEQHADAGSPTQE